MIKEQINERIAAAFAGFRLPRYQDIPDVGLYLEQTVNYVNSYLHPFFDAQVTGSMVSNYVKKKLLKNPVKKQYGREQISTLFFLAVAKSVLSLDHLSVLIEIRDEGYTPSGFHDRFCRELEETVQAVLLRQEKGSSEAKDVPDCFLPETGMESENWIIKSTITAVVHKAYLDQWIANYLS
ncbi:MAG: DUF1836 domain-containing protein [Blautia sp.]|nr:DUF1836 domain-containing protein [Blautia sp.]